MARHVLRGGYDLSVWARRPETVRALCNEGASSCASPRELGEQSDVLCINVTNADSVCEVLFGATGAAEGLRSGSVVIIFSTIEPERVREIGQVLAERAIALIDAPVTGGDVGAREGTLTIMAGGESSVISQVRGLLDTFSRRVVHVGPLGAGQTLKAANQIGVAIGIAAMTEALVFAARAGIDPTVALEVLNGGAAGSWAFQNYAPRLLTGDDAPGFRAEDMLKDIQIALQSAHAVHLELPVTALLRDEFARLVEQYPGEVGNHALHRMYGGIRSSSQDQDD